MAYTSSQLPPMPSRLQNKCWQRTPYITTLARQSPPWLSRRCFFIYPSQCRQNVNWHTAISFKLGSINEGVQFDVQKLYTLFISVSSFLYPKWNCSWFTLTTCSQKIQWPACAYSATITDMNRLFCSRISRYERIIDECSHSGGLCCWYMSTNKVTVAKKVFWDYIVKEKSLTLHCVRENTSL